jgi:transposase
MVSRFFGIDTHKNYVMVAAVDRDQQALTEPTRISMANLPEWAAQHLTDQDQVVLEVSGNTWSVIDLLREYAGDVIAANAYKTKLIAEAHIKNDKVDAEVLAKLLAAHFIPEVWIPDRQVREQRGLANHRATLQKQSTQVKNRLHHLLQRHNLHCPEKSPFSPAGREWLLTLALPAADRLQIRHWLRQLDVLQKELDETDRLIAQLASQDARISRLMQITGISYYIAFALLAAIGDIRRFPTPEKLSAYFGLVPRQHQSGARDIRGSITKEGNSLMRWLTVEAARAAIRWDPHWRKVYNRIARRRGASIAVVAVARRLLVLVWHLLTKNDNYRYLKSQTFVTKLQNWAYRIGRDLLPAASTREFIHAHLSDLGLDDLASSLTANSKGQLRVQSA